MAYPKVTQRFQPGDRIFWDDGVHKYEYEVLDPPHTKYGKVRVREVGNPGRPRTAWWAPNNLPKQARWETAIGAKAIAAREKALEDALNKTKAELRQAQAATLYGTAYKAVTVAQGDTVTISANWIVD